MTFLDAITAVALGMFLHDALLWAMKNILLMLFYAREKRRYMAVTLNLSAGPAVAKEKR